MLCWGVGSSSAIGQLVFLEISSLKEMRDSGTEQKMLEYTKYGKVPLVHSRVHAGLCFPLRGQKLVVIQSSRSLRPRHLQPLLSGIDLSERHC